MRRGDQDVALIPRYFDLLVLLLAQRHRVVTRQEIFDRVWVDVVVSDGALSQAVRTIRRCLGDDSRESQFIRTVSRHGYQLVASGVIEEPDDGPLPGIEGPMAAAPIAEPTAAAPVSPPPDPIAPLLDRLLRREPFGMATDEERRDAAEQLHTLGTAEVLRRLDGVTGHAEARAILRDARWDVPQAGPVELVGSPQPWSTITHLVRLRLRRAAAQTWDRGSRAALGGISAGIVAGAIGGVALWLVPESQAQPSAMLALAMVGAIAGALGAGGVGAGLAAAEALARSARVRGLVFCGAIGGLIAGAVGHLVARATVTGMFGRDIPATGGWVEGLVLGAAAGLGYALSTSPLPGGGLAAPRGWARVRTSLLTGAACAVAAVAVTIAGGHFVAASLDLMSAAFEGSNVGLAPLARLLGEEGLRPMTRTLVSAFEGLMFGAGLAFGLTHRPGR